MADKEFKGLMILNYKNGKVKLLSDKAKRKYLPFEIPIRYKIKVSLPEQKEYLLKGDIVIPEEKVSEMVLEEI